MPWLWPRWRRALRGRDTLTAVLLAWVLIVIAFFSASSGKRGVYVLPAVPALAMAAAPWLPELLRARGPRRVAFALATVVAVLSAGLAAYAALGGEGAERLLARTLIDPVAPLALLALCCGAMLAVFRFRDAWLAWLGVLASVLVVTGLLIYPRMDVDPLGPGLHAIPRGARGRHQRNRLRGPARAVCIAVQAADRLLRSQAASSIASARQRTPRGGSRRSPVERS